MRKRVSKPKNKAEMAEKKRLRKKGVFVSKEVLEIRAREAKREFFERKKQQNRKVSTREKHVFLRKFLTNIIKKERGEIYYLLNKKEKGLGRFSETELKKKARLLGMESKETAEQFSDRVLNALLEQIRVVSFFDKELSNAIILDRLKKDSELEGSHELKEFEEDVSAALFRVRNRLVGEAYYYLGIQ